MWGAGGEEESIRCLCLGPGHPSWWIWSCSQGVCQQQEHHQLFPVGELVGKSDSSFKEVILVAEWLSLRNDWQL